MRKRESYRPSNHHSADTMWLVRHGEQLSYRHKMSGRRLRLEVVSPATLIALKTADLFAEQVQADDEKRWNDSSNLGAAVMALTEAYYPLAILEGKPCVRDGEPQNGAVI